MNFGELRTETQARGFDHKPTSRINRWINQSYKELCEYERWPFLETTINGTPPLGISNLMAVEAVRNDATGQVLYHEPRHTILDSGRAIQVAGAPTRYYIADGDTIEVWPVGTGQEIKVWYWQTPVDLTQDSDTPLVPSRFHNLIVDGAVRRAYKDSDAIDRAEAVEAERRSGLALMSASLLRIHDPALDTPRHLETAQ